MAQGWMPGVVMFGLLALPALAVGAEDDLAVVKKAVGSEAPAPRKGEEPKARAPEPRKGDEPRWLKLRIEDRSQKKAKVSVNLPLDLVKALDEDGEDWPLDWGRHDKRSKVRLGDVLRALKSGQEFVTIEDEDSTVRIWVE
jgi:hypothetical protein